MNKMSVILEDVKSTVVAEYTPLPRRATDYQSEADLENAFIEQLEKQSYEYVNIKNEEALIENLRKHLELLNKYKFSDNEWKYFFKANIANSVEGIEEKTFKIQEDYRQTLIRDDGSTKNIYLIDKANIHNNNLQVLNQYEAVGKYKNRYDVTILVNGLPLVHVELKKRGQPIREAFNQINRYQRDSFWSDSGLFEYVQLFVISNGTHTKYYSNTRRNTHIKESGNSRNKSGKKTSNSFEYTSWWADAQNNPIKDLTDFAATFFAKHSLLNILTKYCVFSSDKELLVMRPYQIIATERIINRIEVSTNYKKMGTIEAGGYVWHTTGSGKTLTSFKTAQLAKELPGIDKVLFVVDRKDLDYQTIKEYDKFHKGAADSNANTRILTKQLSDSNSKIIITTIQKLDKFIKKNHGHKVFKDHIVMIFDECHRGQFGDMHRSITKTFKNYHLFGFTGTPIFAKNSGGGKVDLKTTEQAFGDKLHMYTIVDAVNDKNVLPFKVDYVRTFKEKDYIEDQKVIDINRKKVFEDPRRIKNVVEYILEHFDQKTLRNSGAYSYKQLVNVKEIASSKNRIDADESKNNVRIKGFNSILAVSSIDMLKVYYNEFKKQQEFLPEASRLKVATIFSYSANEAEQEFEGVDDENSDSTEGLDANSRDFLENAIKDYNKSFKTNYDTSSDKFQNYYKDVSLRMKNREIDLLIVVNMFLTGFDAKTLNTLWVDKNLKMHGLVQAFSRTNRILNSIKSHGNIVTFRNLENETKEALALFGDESATGFVLIKTFNEYYNGYEENGVHQKGYVELISELQEKYPLNKQIISEEDKKAFVRLYGKIMSLSNTLISFDEFSDKNILNYRDSQDYRSIYIDIHDEFRPKHSSEKEFINDDLVFEMELIKQTEINVDYIINLLREDLKNNKDLEQSRKDILKEMDSSVGLRNKKDLIDRFMRSTINTENIDDEWRKFVQEEKENELNKIIHDENLNAEKTYKFIKDSFRNGEVRSVGIAISEIMPPIPRFSQENNRAKKREIVLMKLISFFERFVDISNRED